MTQSTIGTSMSVLAGVLLSIFLTARGSGESKWIRGIRAIGEGYEPLMLETIGEQSGHLTATASYREYRDDKRSEFPSTITGVQTSDCRFWPDVTLQVSNELNGEWKTLAQVAKAGQPSTVTLRWKNANIWLHLDFDPFRAAFGKFRYGRVKLSNGGVSTVEIANLSQPPHEPDAWDITVDFLDAEPYNPPFAVAGISSMGEDIYATCEYLESKSKSPTHVEGTETSDGQFWPAVVAQVANDYEGVWRIIGNPKSMGKPASMTIQQGDTNARLHVDLEIFRPMIGKFRYGRVVLKNGKAAPFELKNLLPPE